MKERYQDHGIPRNSDSLPLCGECSWSSDSLRWAWLGSDSTARRDPLANWCLRQFAIPSWYWYLSTSLVADRRYYFNG